MTEEEIWEQQQMRKAEERRQEDAEMERLEQERLARAERSPSLTEAEREAIELAIETWVCKPQLKATLRGLLERTK
jgi:hypothetical protein